MLKKSRKIRPEGLSYVTQDFSPDIKPKGLSYVTQDFSPDIKPKGLSYNTFGIISLAIKKNEMH